MLQEHLSQEHDAASRRLTAIERHVHWIHSELLSSHPIKILDLGCGPGLYTSRFARLGHTCMGIDYSPASIAYARNLAASEDLQCRYQLGDIRTADYGSAYGLVMLIFGEVNVFKPKDARRILHRAHRALADGGLLLLEPHTFAAVQRRGEEGCSWYSARRGLFSDQPHLCLQEGLWNPLTHAATIRYFLIDGATGNVSRYAQSLQAYTDEELGAILSESGFADARIFPSLSGDEGEIARSEVAGDFFALMAHKRPNAG
jgi:SAM-dependent methyltransferase